MRIGIVGLGVVGSAIMVGLQQIGHEVSFYDIKFSNTSIESVLHSDVIFVCVPTNSLPDNSRCDISVVEQIVKQLTANNYNGIVAIKSTVIPGTTEKLIAQYNLKICFVPEFLRQKSALSDFQDLHDILVVGTNDDNIFNIIKESHGSIPQNIIKISATEAEIVKYFNNVHNAMEIVFANAVHEITNKLGGNYQNVYNAVTKRNNINPNYLRCSEYYKGFSGACLPKDTEAWAILAKDLNVDVKLFDAIINDNKRYI